MGPHPDRLASHTGIPAPGEATHRVIAAPYRSRWFRRSPAYLDLRAHSVGERVTAVKVIWRPDAVALRRQLGSHQGEEFSYADVGATRHERLPAGYHHVTRRMQL